MQLIKVTTAATGQFGIAANSVGYFGFSQGALQTTADGQINALRVTNQGNPVALSAGVRVEVGLLADNGRFCVQLTRRHGRT